MIKKIILCVLAVAALSACGVKPKNVKPPEGATTIYPRSYPAAEDDNAL